MAAVLIQGQAVPLPTLPLIWILSTGFWADGQNWLDSAFWID